jgi:pyruvate/2-oxoglutarate dehydrogenase complex dihydrolipoamide dehydrogenase (E3) component
MTRRFDGIVIGSGQGGNPLGEALARAGWAMALVEREHAGGTCVNEGCTPTKTLIASARVAYLISRAREFGVVTGPSSIDMASVRERKRSVVRAFRTGVEGRIERTPGLDLVRGEATFTGPRTLRVTCPNGETIDLEGDRMFIDVGSRPAAPPLPGLDGVPALDSTSIMELDVVPEHLLVLGGGYVGIEFGQFFRRLGSRVTIVQRGPVLLAREDQDVAEEVTRILVEDGIVVRLDSEATRVAASGPAGAVLTVASAGEEATLEGSHLLVATGRTPNVDALNLPAAGVRTDSRGFIEVDDRLETSADGIYALGDVKGGPAFTHIAYDDFRILRGNLLDGGDATTRDRVVPYTVFMDPQLGRVGLSEAEARRRGHRVRVARLPMSAVARAIEMGETRGFMKAVVDADTDRILGASILGVEGGELMAMVEIAMLGKLPSSALRDAVFAHPTLAESLNNLFANLE